MDPISGLAAIGATTAYNSWTSKQAAEMQYKYERKLQQHDQEFQERMSNTAIQRQMADADAAGLNANLLYANGGGSGASTPSGGHNGVSVSPIDVGTALEFALQKDKTDAEIRNLDANTGKTKVETEIAEITRKYTPEIIKSQTKKQQQETATEIARTAQAQIEAEMKRLDLTKRDKQYWQEIEIYKKELEAKLIELGFDTSVIGSVINGIGKTVNAVSPFVQGGRTNITNTYNQPVQQTAVRY